MHRRESRASIDIATAERSPSQAFLKTVERQQREDLDAAPAKNRKQRNDLDAAPAKQRKPAPRRLKWTRQIEILQNQLKQEAKTKTGWERQLHKKAADALQQNLNLRKLYIETGEGLGRWKHMSTASGSAPRVRRKRGQECKSGEGTKNARNKDNNERGQCEPEWCPECNAPSSQCNVWP